MQVTPRILLSSFSVLLLFIQLGCGGAPEVARADVEGTVTYKGDPVEEGFIQFIPTAGVKGSLVQLSIKDGHYNTRTDKVDSRGVAIGLNDVQILANKKTGKQIKNPMNEMEDEIIQYIPAKYNIETTLHKEIEPGENKIDFNLE